MTIPIKFRTGGEGAVASYDAVDIAEGVGMIIFYPIASRTSAGYDYHLTRQVLHTHSDKLTIEPAAYYSGALSKQKDIDFDLSPFNQPKTIKGTALFSLGIVRGAITGGTKSCYIIIKVRKWDGTTETEIANVTSDIYTGGGTWAQDKTWLIPLTIPQTLFKRGETLRITIETWLKATAGSISLGYGIDPKDRAHTLAGSSKAYITTTSKFLIPFRIET